MPSEQLGKQLEIKHLILTFLILFALMVPFLYTLLLILKQPLLTAVSLIVILTLIRLWRKGEVSRAAWLLPAWFASIWAVSALLGVFTVEFFPGDSGVRAIAFRADLHDLTSYLWDYRTQEEDGRSTHQRSS
jgi:hypothetical protein